MSHRCVVVDDERPARERLARLLAEHPDFRIVGEAADADSAVRLIDELAPDLCFLDVQMPEGDGFQVLARLRRVPHVIFTTAHDQYAVRAFEVHSLDYLLKPFGKRRFAEALDRARRALCATPAPSERLLALLDDIRRDLRGRPAAEPEAGATPERLAARRGSRIVLLPPAEVLWFEAEETLVFARTAQGRFLVERTLSDLEERLAPGFFRTHRRYLVNVACIGEIVPEEAGTFRISMRGASDLSVPLSRRQSRKLRERIPW